MSGGTVTIGQAFYVGFSGTGTLDMTGGYNYSCGCMRNRPNDGRYRRCIP